MLAVIRERPEKLFSLCSVSPYITASIIVQLLQMDILPKFVEWGKRGEVGRRKLNQATRYISLVLAFVQSIGITAGLNALSGAKLTTMTPQLADLCYHWLYPHHWFYDCDLVQSKLRTRVMEMGHR